MPEGRADVAVPANATRGVVVLHPHPDMGGDRFNPVVGAVFGAATEHGCAAVRFDFSSSDLDIAAGEAAEALDLLPDGLPVAVVGYSFGAAVAARLLDDRVTSWVLIAPPFGPVPAAGLPVGADPRPKLLLVPVHDQFCPPATARTETATWEATTLEDVQGADHFIGGAIRGVAERALAFVRS